MVASKNRSRGRPTKYSRSVVGEICARLEASDTGLARMLDEAPDLPCPKTVWTWMAAKPDFSQKIAEAKERQLESMQYRGVELIDSVDCAASHAIQTRLLRSFRQSAEVLRSHDCVPERLDGRCHRIAVPLVASDYGTDENAHEALPPRKIGRG